VCGNYDSSFWYEDQWIHVLVIIIALASLYLNMRYMVRFSMIIQQLKTNYRKNMDKKAKHLKRVNLIA
jgi:hypothetical protein